MVFHFSPHIGHSEKVFTLFWLPYFTLFCLSYIDFQSILLKPFFLFSSFPIKNVKIKVQSKNH